jgi:hypothetical protein
MAYIGVSPQNGVRKKHTYTASGSQTSFTGAGAEGITLSYKDSNFVDVYQNGVKLAEADYTSTSGTTIVLAQGAAANDIVEIIVYDVFSTSDMVSASDGGTFAGNVAMSGTLTLTGNGDFNGDLDVDGTLETDALTINGVTLAETISDTVGAMVSGNTETGITVTYQDGDNTLDFVVGTLNQDTTGTAANATLAATVTVTDSTANTNFPIVFHDESNALLDDTGALRYNPSTGELLVPKLTVAGTTTTVDTVTMNAANAVVFEGATADAHETTLTIVDPTADRTINLPNVSGTIPVLAAASNTAITSTPAELNILDGATVVVGEINALDLGSTAVGTAIASKAVILDSNKDYTGIRNFTTTGVVTSNAGVVVDEMTIDGDTLTATDTFTIDSANIITLDSAFSSGDAGGIIRLADAGTQFGDLHEDSGNFLISSAQVDKDLIFKGNDGGAIITALTLDMSAAGAATFNSSVTAASLVVDTITLNSSTATISGSFTIDSGGDINLDASGTDFTYKVDGTEFLRIDKSGDNARIESKVSDGDLIFRGNDGGTAIEAMRIDMSEGGRVGIGMTPDTSVKLSINGGIGTTNGGAGGPTHTFYSDADTGMFRAAANTLGFATGGSERGRFDSSGNLTVGAGGSSISAPNPAVIIKPSGVINMGNNSGSNGTNFIELRRNGTQIGAVQQSGTTGIAYQTSSDYRLKENVAYDFDATTRLKQLKPCRFNFIAEADRTVDGFLAHEVSSVVPEAINGEKDAMTAEVLYVDGDEIPNDKKVGDVKEASTIDPQQIDQAKLVPLLTKALQEQQATIEALTARITALESA